MLKIIKDNQIRPLAGERTNVDLALLNQHICPDITYTAFSETVKTVEVHFGLPDTRFTIQGACLGAATAQFTATKDISAIRMACGWRNKK